MPITHDVRLDLFGKGKLMSQDYNNGYNLDNLKKLLNFKGVVKKDNLDEKLVKIFNFFDANHNGQLESNELTQILNQVTQYGASRNKSIFDKQEATSFVNSYKNAQNKTLKQLGVNADNLYQFLDKVKNNVNKQTINRKITMNLEVTGLNTYRELAQWLFRQEGKKPSETELQKRTNELINLNKNSNPPIQNGKLKGNYVKISISQKGINNVSKYITKQAFKAISGMNWNASGIKKIQKMFDKGEINRYDIVEFLDNFNHKKDKDGNVISETQQGDTSIIDAIISETEWGNNSNKIKLLTSIIENVYWAAIDAGVPKATVSKLTAEYKKEMNKQMKFFEGTGIASADAQGMENALNSLIGQIKVARLGVKTKTDYSRAKRFAQDNKSAVSGDITNNNAVQTAKEFYNIVDNNSGSTSMQKLKALVYNPKKFNYKNVVDVITAYNQTGIRQGDADIIDSILSESHTDKAPTVNHQNKTYIANGEAYDVINKILNTLKQSAKEKGVPDRFLTEARTEWAKEMYKLKISKTSKLEENEVHTKYINKLIDLIGGKNVGATGAYAGGRASDSWVGIGADKVFGLFGCKTMSEMEAKLGNQAQNAKVLVNIANHIKSAKTNAEKAKFMQQFKVKYKAIFGVDYNPQVMAAREELQDKVAQVQINKSLQPVFNKALGTKDISSMKKVIEDCKIVMGKDDKTKKNIYLADIINMQVDAYMQAKAPQGLILSNPNEYNKMYSEIYKNIVSNMKAEYQKTAKDAIGNSSYEQMQIDMEQLNQAAYGTTNIGKEVAKFNQNQAMTQQYSELALDIGATIATCWIPGLGEAAGLKMVATFGKLAQSATKMAKFYKALETAGKTLYKGSKFVKGIQTTSAIGKMEQVGDKTVRTIKIGQKTVQLGKVTNIALESAVSGAYNMINTGVTITTLHGLEHFNKNQNWKANWEAGKGMAIFGGVSAVGGFAGKLASQIASKMGISLEIAQKSLAFVVSEGANFGYANAETVMAYIKQKQKTDPSFNFSKMSIEELWEVICSDENLINNVIMATMTTVTRITQKMSSKAGRDNLIDNITETKFEKHSFDGKDPITKNEHPTNLTNELERAWYSNDELKILLHNNPNLKRSVGALPQKWGRDIGTKNGFEKVDNIFYEFSSSIYENFSGENINNQLNIMQNKLSQVLGKNVEIKYLGKGNVGFTFTVEVDGQKFVLKTYNKNSDFLNNNIRHQENQGNYAELKSAVYASKHDKNHFAMFYMGRFGETNEGYMLTKFVEHKEMVKSNRVNNMPITDYRNIAFEQHFEKRLVSADIKSDNVFGKTIIDYGAVHTSIADNLNAKELKLAQIISKALDNNLEGEINNIVLKYGNTKEFKNVVLALKEIIDETCNKNNYKLLQTKKAMLDKLGLDTKPDLKYLLETGCLDVNRVHNYTEMYKFTENELIQMQKQYNEKHVKYNTTMQQKISLKTLEIKEIYEYFTKINLRKIPEKINFENHEFKLESKTKDKIIFTSNTGIRIEIDTTHKGYKLCTLVDSSNNLSVQTDSKNRNYQLKYEIDGFKYQESGIFKGEASTISNPYENTVVITDANGKPCESIEYKKGTTYSYNFISQELNTTSFFNNEAKSQTQKVSIMHAEDIYFSQKDISNAIDDITTSMTNDGWTRGPIHAIRMPDGKIISMDNKRLAAARKSGTDVHVVIHQFNEPLSDDLKIRFGIKDPDTKNFIEGAITWGEAIFNRIYLSGFVSNDGNINYNTMVEIPVPRKKGGINHTQEQKYLYDSYRSGDNKPYNKYLSLYINKT